MESLILEEITKKNPHIDKSVLAANMDLLDKLRACAKKTSRYRLATPFSGRKVQTAECEDSRTVKLRSQRV